MWGLDIASEKKMRVEARELVGDNLQSEMVPFSFKHKDGGEIIKEAPPWLLSLICGGRSKTF